MKTMAMTSIQRLWKAPIEAFLVLKPPVATVLIAWLTASKRFIPATI